jgi:hypothetical protein
VEPLQEEEYGYEDSELAADSAGAGPFIGGPERELKAASEMPDEQPAAAAAPPQPGFVRSPEIEVPARTPEAWYAQIEKLRAAGRVEEADRELEQLKKAYPGWLEQYLKKQSER